MLSDVLLDFSWTQLLQPQFYIEHGGFWLIMFIIFAETGLFIGFFLPGDSLLFVTGIYSQQLVKAVYATESDFVNLSIIILLITLAGFVGNEFGFYFGRKSGDYLFRKEDTWYFKKKHLVSAKDFYEKHGGMAIIFARFLPIVRTFAPIVAGIVGMAKKKFLVFNFLGCLAWVFLMIAGGHYLYRFFLERYSFDLTEHLEVIVLVLVLITTAPVIVKIVKDRRHHQ
ncbi:MAG: VTT domain-containing protein [Chitinophagaceae bacterium]